MRNIVKPVTIVSSLKELFVKAFACCNSIKLLNLSLIPFFVIVFLNCTQTTTKPKDFSGDTLKNYFAKNFSIIKKGEDIQLDILNPWQKANNVKISYLLTPKNELKKSASQYESIIKMPVQKVICMSTTHIAFIDRLHNLSSIVGVSGGGLVSNKNLRIKIAKDEIKDVGYEQSLNYELLLKLAPDVVFIYGVDSQSSGYISKCKELGIQTVFIADYLESSPLAKAEWLKVFGIFFNQYTDACSVFDSISDNYAQLKEKVTQIKIKPTVMTGLPWNGTWYISGNKSNLATLIHDAGGNYIWNNLDNENTVPVDFEKVFQQSLDAEYWINCGNVFSIKEILKVDERLKILRPIKNGNVFNNSARVIAGGGNDYWESGVVMPDVILKDLIAILHPEVLKGYNYYFYQKLK